MLLSMTGYGKSKVKLGDKAYSVEIKSLNSKQLDLNFKIIAELREKELVIRKMISEKLVRGKIDLYFQEDRANGSAGSLNFTLIEQYFNQLQSFSTEKNIPLGDVIPAILRFQDINKTELCELDDDDVAALHKSVSEALDDIIEFRKAEGEELEKDLIGRINAIQQLKNDLLPFEKNRIEKLREKLKQDLANHLQDESIDKNRFEEELIYYLEKIDINEEKVRLDTHCNYFLEMLEEKGYEKGKKLGFIAQEIGREINTIGSKANDAEMQKSVILMKEELEKIKEQVLNIL
ncbi:MAG: YicC family protein [Bacteroidota bacterium]|nr:YicC family protein [Bacteroidota bacterium]